MSIEKLITSVVNCSESKTWELGKKEFEIKGNYYMEDGKSENCECGRLIKEVFIVRNKLNNKELRIGSTCISKFQEKELDDYMIEMKKKDKEFNKLLRKEKTIIKKQIKNNVPQSVHTYQMNEAYELGIINDYEYNFYKDIYDKVKLSDKQKAFKIKVNSKINMD